MISVTRPFLKLMVHRLLGGFTQTPPKQIHAIDPFDSYSVAVDSIGELVADTSSFGVVLYLSNASMTVHCFLAAILFKTSVVLFRYTFATCTHHSRSWIHLSSRKRSNCLLLKAASLSVRISSGGPRS